MSSLAIFAYSVADLPCRLGVGGNADNVTTKGKLLAKRFATKTHLRLGGDTGRPNPGGRSGDESSAGGHRASWPLGELVSYPCRHFVSLCPQLGSAFTGIGKFRPRLFSLGTFCGASIPRCIAMVPADMPSNLVSRILKREERTVYSFGCFLETVSPSGFQGAYRIRINPQLSIVPMGQHVAILAHTALQAHRPIW
jgi:hypothetical protein